MWLRDGYVTGAPLQLDKAAVLKMVDDAAGRLVTLTRGGQLEAVRR